MPQIVVLPHPTLCPDGAVLEAPAGVSLCDGNLFDHNTITGGYYGGI